MFPDPLPDWVRSDPLRAAEVEVYDALRSQLSSRYSVFYSRPWIGTNYDGTEKEGEADFVVASAETGYLVVEVKGGGVGREAQTGGWFSIDRHRRRHTIKDPIKQALRSKNEILEKLKQVSGLEREWIGVASAVVLPDCSGREMLIGADVPPDHFALAEDMGRLGEWVCERLTHTLGGHGGALGQSGLAALEHLLAQSFQLRVPLSRTIDGDYEKIVIVTEQQYALLEFLQGHSRAAIGGSAGSGKTILALHKAVELAATVRPAPVLLTCYNTPLAFWLRTAGRKSDNLRIGSFHEVCIRTAREAGVSVPAGNHSQDYFDAVLPDALLEAIDTKPELMFAGIIVDEGQDFSDRWLEVLQLALRSEDSPFWVFYDDNQQIYGRSASLLQAMPQPPFTLRKNVRNTRFVFDRLRPFLEGSAIAPLGPQGRPVEEILVNPRSSLKTTVSRVVTRMVEDDQIDPEDIAILVSRKEQITEICPEGKFGRIGVCNAETEPLGRICIDTVRRFKGLERKVIVLVEPADMIGSKDLLYVGLSRPTAHLVLITRKPLPVERTIDD